MSSEVKLEDLIKKMNLENLTPDIDIKDIFINEPDVNRPALQLTGFFEHFDEKRVQIIGHVEYTYIEHLSREDRCKAYDNLLDRDIPCIIFTRNQKPCETLIEKATKKKVPIFLTERMTSVFIELIG